jgi:DNA cross-link repair 1A protein
LTKNYFLTHFHADHYGGIHSTWHLGTIYCSLPTANLVNQQLGVDKKYLHPLPLNTPTVVASRGKPVTITLLDANHCPGAVMFLFEIGKRKILHVGDFRWNRNLMMQHNPIREIASRHVELDELFLDTTYCDPKYSLPSQDDTIEAVVKLFQQHKSNRKRTLHLFGAYTIGKERMYLSVAERFGLKVYVDKSRYRVLSALEWPKERLQVLTTNQEDSCVWVVPLGHINMKKLPEYFQIANNKPFALAYEHIVGYRPTGWSLSSKPSATIGSSRNSGNLTIHSIPYSEHSSFPELVDCLACLRPARIVPTVSASKSQEQVEALLNGLRMKQSAIRLGSSTTTTNTNSNNQSESSKIYF